MVESQLQIDPQSIFIGSSEYDVLTELGEPTEIDPAKNYIWNYGLAKIYFDEAGNVSGWQDYISTIVNGMPKGNPGADEIFMGSTKTEVLNNLGPSSSVESSRQYIWEYGLAKITIDNDGNVIEWKNYNGILNVVN